MLNVLFHAVEVAFSGASCAVVTAILDSLAKLSGFNCPPGAKAPVPPNLIGHRCPFFLYLGPKRPAFCPPELSLDAQLLHIQEENLLDPPKPSFSAKSIPNSVRYHKPTQVLKLLLPRPLIWVKAICTRSPGGRTHYTDPFSDMSSSQKRTLQA